MDFDLAKSITVTRRQYHGLCNPDVRREHCGPPDLGGYIDELVGGVSYCANWHQRACFVRDSGTARRTVHDQHELVDDVGRIASLSALNTNSIVQVSGTLDPADQTLDADEVAIVSDKNFYASGQVTYVTPASRSQPRASTCMCARLNPQACRSHWARSRR